MVAIIYGNNGKELGKILVSYDMLTVFEPNDLYAMYNSGITFNEMVAKYIQTKALKRYGDFDSYTITFENWEE